MRRKTNVLHYQMQSVFDWAWFCSQKPSDKLLLNIWYRFSAFWLRSRCSICSYQLNIWYEVHRTSSILNWFLDGDGVSVACYGSIKCWPCIAVPQGSAHFPTNYLSLCFICFHGLRSAFCIGATIMFKCITQMLMVTLHQLKTYYLYSDIVIQWYTKTRLYP